METVNRHYKVAVVGPEPLSLGFSLAGVTESYKPETQQEADQVMRDLLQRDNVGLIAVSSIFIRGIRDRRLQEAVTSSILPLVIELPGYGEEVAEDTLRRLIIRAIGIDMQGNGNGNGNGHSAKVDDSK